MPPARNCRSFAQRMASSPDVHSSPQTWHAPPAPRIVLATHGGGGQVRECSAGRPPRTEAALYGNGKRCCTAHGAFECRRRQSAHSHSSYKSTDLFAIVHQWICHGPRAAPLVHTCRIITGRRADDCQTLTSSSRRGRDGLGAIHLYVGAATPASTPRAPSRRPIGSRLMAPCARLCKSEA